MAIANPILNFVVRGFQALFGIVVLGISVSLIRGHHWGALPASLGFAAFVGGVTILGAAIGVAGLFMSFLDGKIGLIIDAVVAIINAAGGIVSIRCSLDLEFDQCKLLERALTWTQLLALKLRGVSCTEATIENAAKFASNTIINGGCRKKDDCWYFYEENDPETMVARCRSVQADDVCKQCHCMDCM
jgi:hypothetical protein